MWATTSQAQTPSLYDKVLLGKINVLDSAVKVLIKRVDTLIWANTKMLALIYLQDETIRNQNIIIANQNSTIQAHTEDIKLLKAGQIITNNEIESMKRMIVPFNKMTYLSPLIGAVDKTTENAFIINIDIEALKRLLQ